MEAKSRVHWLKERDSNIKFFHNCATTRKGKNKITKLNDDSGEIDDTANSLEGVAIACFLELFAFSSLFSQEQVLEVT